LGFSNVNVNEGGDGGVTSDEGDNVTLGNNTAAPDGDRGGIDAVQGGQAPDDDDNKVNPGAFVAAGLAALILVLVALFVTRRRRSTSEEEALKLQNLTDDEDMEAETNSLRSGLHSGLYSDSNSPARKSYVVEDASEGEWTKDPDNEGREVDYVTTFRDSQAYSTAPSWNQGSTRFIVTDSAVEPLALIPDVSDRHYVAEDTVNL
jgi:hypothetical protein